MHQVALVGLVSLATAEAQAAAPPDMQWVTYVLNGGALVAIFLYARKTAADTAARADRLERALSEEMTGRREDVAKYAEATHQAVDSLRRVAEMLSDELNRARDEGEADGKATRRRSTVRD